MHKWAERCLVYSALGVICIGTGMMLGWVAGLCTFLQVAVVVEVTYWLCRPTRDRSA